MRLTVVYNGEEYHRLGGTWVDECNITAPASIQRMLDRQYKDKYLCDLTSLSNEKILVEAKFFKNNGSANLALELLKYLYDRQAFLKVVPSMLASCYRLTGKPEAAIALYEEIVSIYGHSFATPELLTSVAAAFLDVKQAEDAKKRCDQGYAKSNGNPSDELKSVYQRLRSEAPWLFS